MLVDVDGFRALTYSAKPSVRVYDIGTAQTISNTTPTVVTFDTEEYDRWGMHNTSSNSGRLTVVVPGIYLLEACTQYVANATGGRTGTINHFNSSDVRRARLAGADQAAHPTAVTTVGVVGYSLVAAVGDYFISETIQSSGGDLDLVPATADLQHRISFAAVWHSLG